MERSLPDPRHAFKNELALMKRQIRQTRSRQGWPGKVQTTPLSTLTGATRTGFADTGYTTTTILRLDPGAWTLTGRASASVPVFTGREVFYTRLVTATGEVIDYVAAAPAATPGGGGWMDQPVMLFGLVTLPEPMEIQLQVQAVDTGASHACNWHHKMMATPV
jgi:hypothetical protein